MARRMSCALTIDQVRNRTKTVTRRVVGTWAALKPGDKLTLVEKGMGLAKGERQVVLAEVEITSVTVEQLDGYRMSQADVDAEGFPWMTPDEFVAFWCEKHGHQAGVPGPLVRRIEWRYL